MQDTDLVQWLKDHSSGVYRPSAEAAERISDLIAEVENWKFVASYLACCHAATLENLPKSTPRRTRERFADICKNSALYLRGKGYPPFIGGFKRQQIESNTKRCEDAVKDFGTIKP